MREEALSPCIRLEPRNSVDAFVANKCVKRIFVRELGRWCCQIFSHFLLVGLLLLQLGQIRFRFPVLPESTSGLSTVDYAFSVPPVLSATSLVFAYQPQALEHCSLFVLGIILLSASTKTISAVVVIGIPLGGFFAVNRSLHPRCGINAQRTWAVRGETRAAAIAGEVAPSEEFHECMFTMAGDAA